MASQYFCQNEQRKNAVRLDPTYNGIDYLEVADEAQQILRVRFLKADHLGDLTIGNMRIEGGQRIKNILVAGVSTDEHDEGVLVVALNQAGDFSPYTLRIVQGPGYDAPLEWMDPVFSSVEFSFKAACPSEFDCRATVKCPPEAPQEPEIDYLAKDYGSFRRLMLDRLSVVMPQWKERNPSDIGVAAVEALAYAADRLSYYQDAVATEAYLGTARRRVSVRRHARLLDYYMHDGCNARAWVVITAQSGADGYVLRAHTPLLTSGALTADVLAAECAASTPVTPSPHVAFRQFAVFAMNSVCFEENVQVHSGHVGANLAAAAGSAGAETAVEETLFPCGPGWSVVVGADSHLHGNDTAVYGERVLIETDARVYDVFCNEMENNGILQGSQHSPLTLPLLDNLPVMPEVESGTEDVKIKNNKSKTLSPGQYGKLVMEEHATLRLTGGTYHFRSWQVGEHGAVKVEGPSEIRIAGRLDTDANVHIGPSEESPSLGAWEVVIFAAGEAGEGDAAYESVAIVMGENNRIVAWMHAPDGLVRVGGQTEVWGALFGRWVSVGKQVQLHLSAPEEAPAPPQETQPAERRIVVAGLSPDVSVFETLHDITLRGVHNQIAFYTWGDEQCCLPKGATRASLRNEGNALQRLREGDVLFFEEVLGLNGKSEDAEVSHRHAVRLTRVEFVKDPLYQEKEPYIENGIQQQSLRVVNIEWAPEDALPFPLCLWVVEIKDDQGTVADRQPMSVARANVVLADHGRTICDESLVPEIVPSDASYRPRFQRTDITIRVPYDDERARTQPANGLLLQDPRAALPDADLRGNTERWSVQRDLLESDRFALEYVVETENDERAYVRFGDNVLGKRPTSGTAFRATYRVGSGIAGNVGAETITRVLLPEGESTIQDAISARNPLPARGGTEPESIEQVKLYAPQAFRTQERAVTPDDYADMAQRHPEVQKAVATQRWTGSWHTVFIAVDRRGGLPVDQAFEQELRDFLEPFRTMGHDLEIEVPRMVALDIALRVCVGPEYRRVEVKTALLDEFSSSVLPDGRLGFFHPDNFTFGQGVYLSQVVAAAMQVPGVVWVQAERYERWGELSRGELEAGVITMAGLEIARLDNDPNAPENGRIEFLMQGGL